MLGEKQSRPLKFVCSDMWRAYLKVIAKKAAGAVRVLDRFHIMQKMNQAIDQVRAAETKRLKADGHEPLLKHSRWCPLKRPDNLTEKQAVKLSELLQYNLRSHESTMHSADCRWYLRSPSNRETSGRRSGGVGDPRRAPGATAGLPRSVSYGGWHRLLAEWLRSLGVGRGSCSVNARIPFGRQSASPAAGCL